MPILHPAYHRLPGLLNSTRYKNARVFTSLFLHLCAYYLYSGSLCVKDDLETKIGILNYLIRPIQIPAVRRKVFSKLRMVVVYTYCNETSAEMASNIGIYICLRNNSIIKLHSMSSNYVFIQLNRSIRQISLGRGEPPSFGRSLKKCHHLCLIGANIALHVEIFNRPIGLLIMTSIAYCRLCALSYC